MGIFFCPRLRAYWKKPDPPGTGPAYPLHPVTSPPNGAVESGQGSAQFTSREDAVRFSSSGTSAGGLSEKLRKRFSREHKGLHEAPTRAARKSESPTLRDPSRFASKRLDTISPVGFGSSLMSERGYDSDAQFISTPKQINRTPDRLVAENLVHETTSLSKLQSHLVSPRKVSVGWMSGGRRLGYGYTLVSAAEENDRPSKEQSGPCAINGSSQDATPETDTQTEKATLVEDQPQQQDITSLSKKAGTGLDISSIIGHINLRSWSGATNETAGDESLKSSLLGKFSKRKKDHSDPEPSAGAKDPWDFCAWVDPNQSPSEQQPPQASPSASSMSTEGRGMSLGRWSTLRRTGSLWAKGRSMSAMARDLEAKATAKLNASAGRFPVIQKKDGRAMKFRVLDRKRRAQTDEDGEPMVPLKQWPGGKHKSSHEEDGPSSPSVDPVRKQFSEQTGSTVVTDGWESNYQDCEEIFSVGE
ncbi:uncharacterized protein BO72DRAFT_525169 [Aspergillus fijiensis CBS 313.89]|uniref:Uncharacterized protein n=1 Tax=Aspergillus fijiensis CBS 313.89 TaxID=1448319 RepID=A0A8G1W510_9EURO|nr:uncharacterized protein BO72DRAFT_525169 [Aspergillus fijiensis CBS 313.89]RAK80704.1 hypothetical protein BO72DRAFT_525169 [Aspergillus fijiensis CBS 313.89]